MNKSDKLLHRITTILLLSTLVVSAVFFVFPQLDLYVSGLFVAQGGGFPLAESPALNSIRLFLIKMMWLFVFVSALGFSVAGFLGKQRHIPLRIWAYPLAVSFAGPLMLVNVILKNNWGRARPYTVTEFGGNLDFTPAFVISDQCVTNCSFTSGEGGAIATVTVVIGVLLWRNIRHNVLLGSLVPLFILGAGLRVIKGQHFISDTVLSALFCSMIALFFYWLMNISAHRQKLTLTNLRADLQVLRKKVSRK